MSSNPFEEISEEMVLAAIERAERHSHTDRSGAAVWTILQHLGLTPRSRGARQARHELQSLHDAGWLERSPRTRTGIWSLTSTGRRRLRNAKNVPALPESPQHRAWRDARTLAGQEIEQFRDDLRVAVDDAAALLQRDRAAHSDVWFELGGRLGRAAWRVGSATHCLREWQEPDDLYADVDVKREPGDEQLDPDERARLVVRRAGRRNPNQWLPG
jgi:hypothetical protein